MSINVNQVYYGSYCVPKNIFIAISKAVQVKRGNFSRVPLDFWLIWRGCALCVALREQIAAPKSRVLLVLISHYKACKQSFLFSLNFEGFLFEENSSRNKNKRFERSNVHRKKIPKSGSQKI